MKRPSTWLYSVMAFGFAFLYVPIVVVMVYSFNDSRLMNVWSGFSLRWYKSLLDSSEIMEALVLTLQIAVVSATIATVLGTLAGLAMNRMGRFRGRTLFSGMIAAPLVMPEVITGLSLLLLFIGLKQLIGFPESRGANTITIAHATFSMAYVAVIVQARLSGMDRSLEEAAMDLGGRPFAVTRDITLPLLAPAMAAGWLLAFTLSLDELVITSFVTGAGATTLPLEIFSRVRLGITPEINALATLMIGTVALVMVVIGWSMLRRNLKPGTN
jgi:putrescine transport system permease protein